MDRRYSCALLLIVFFACVQIPGCGGGGSKTTPLAVTTTSLLGGTVNTPYYEMLEAMGGTAPYTWSQTSGGKMPPGVTLNSSGTFSGTPTAAGTFGPYVFKVTDSASNTATSQSLSLTISSSSLAVTTKSLPNGIVGTAYSATIAASGGTSPYSWSETSGGALPPGLDSTSAGVISGTPTTAGVYGPYVFTVTDAKSTTATSVSLIITITGTAVAVCTPMGNEAALTSVTPYAFLLKGTDGSGNPIDIAGSFTPDGSGGITDATADYNGLTNGPEQLQVNLAGSSYSFSTSTQGCLYLAFSGLATTDASALRHGAAIRSGKAAKPAIVAAPVSNVQFSFYLGGFDRTIYTTGRIIESDNANGGGANASGFIHVQTTSAFAISALASNFAFGVDGWTTTATATLRTAMAGTFTNVSGTLSGGYADVNAGGTSSGYLSGGYGVLNSTIDTTTGRGTGSYYLTPSPGKQLTFDFAFYIVNESDLILLSTDLATSNSTTPLLSGRALASNVTYPTGPLNGYYLLAAQGLAGSTSSAGNLVEIGTMNATSAGTVPTATIYSNSAGSYTSKLYPNSSYSYEAASGRIAFSGLTTKPIVYSTNGASDDGIAGFLVGMDTGASSGVLVNQASSAPSFTTGSVAGGYAASTEEDVDGKNGAFLAQFTFNGTGAYTLTSTVTGSLPNVPGSKTISINPDGSGSLDGGKFPLVTSGTVLFAIPNSGDPLLFVFTEDTLPIP
jgi:hypothetical protein